MTQSMSRLAEFRTNKNNHTQGPPLAHAGHTIQRQQQVGEEPELVREGLHGEIQLDQGVVRAERG